MPSRNARKSSGQQPLVTYLMHVLRIGVKSSQSGPNSQELLSVVQFAVQLDFADDAQNRENSPAIVWEKHEQKRKHEIAAAIKAGETGPRVIASDVPKFHETRDALTSQCKQPGN